MLQCSRNPLKTGPNGPKVANLKAKPILFKFLPQNLLGLVVLVRLEPSVNRKDRQSVYARGLNIDAASGVNPSNMTAHSACDYFQVGTVLITSRGGLVVEKIEVGDIVLRPDGLWRRVAWISETQQEVADATSSQSTDDASSSHKTRFPGIRFVRGRPAARLYQVIFAPVEDGAKEASFDVSPEFRPIPDAVGKVIDKSSAESSAARAPSFISVRATPKSPLEIA